MRVRSTRSSPRLSGSRRTSSSPPRTRRSARCACAGTRCCWWHSTTSLIFKECGNPVPLDDPEVIDVRPEEQLDIARVEPYLREHLPHASGKFSLRQFGGGHANLTYLVAFGDDEYVLRRPPLGPVPERSHDMR